MKKLILIAALLALAGCNSVKPWPVYADQQAQEAAVEEFIRAEVWRISDKRDVIEDMLKSGKITSYEYMLLMDKCDEDKANIVPRARELFGN